MRRALPYLGMVAALLVFGIGVVRYRAQPTMVVQAPVVVFRAATSTVAAPPQPLESLPQPAIEKTVHDPDALAAVSARLRSALVNIFCLATRESGVRSISASGVVVSERGYIVTNAHVGQYFLLGDRGVECTIRTGSPAAATHRAELVYLSPAWVAANPRTLLAEAPVGTGEHDSAVLVLTGVVSGVETSGPLTYVPLATDAPQEAAPVVLGSYAAQYLSTEALQNALYPTLLAAYVDKLFTFGTREADVFTVRGSGTAQEGASGGGVVTMRGELAGLITVSRTTGQAEDRYVSAISARYIAREYREQAGHALDTLFAQEPVTAQANFAPMAEALRQTLENEIDRR